MSFIEANGLGFSYSPEEPKVLSGLNVKIEKGGGQEKN